jgi:hypothetical protein
MPYRVFPNTQNHLPTPEKEDNRCTYLPPQSEEEKMLDFRDQILV